MKFQRLMFLLVATCFLGACGGGKSDPPGNPPTPPADGGPTEDEIKTEARKALLRPLEQGEFTMIIEPDESIKKAYAVPVDVLTVSALAAESWRSKSAEDYWKSPSGDKSFVFGIKEGGVTSKQQFTVPFRDGESAVVVILKLYGSSEAAKPYVYELKREPNLDNPLEPVIRDLVLRVTPGGIQAR